MFTATHARAISPSSEEAMLMIRSAVVIFCFNLSD